MKAIQFKNHFEVIDPTYTTLHIIPHSSIRNYNSSGIAKMVTTMYKSMRQSIYKVDKKYVLESKAKCSYVIDVVKDNVNFYFIVPIQYKHIAKEKIQSVWDKATIEECSSIPKITQRNIHTYQLNYTKLDSFSLNVDNKSNYPLNNILNVIDIMEDSDRVTIAYNFMPCSQYGWNTKCEKAQEKFKNNLPINKEVSGASIAKYIIYGILDFLDRFLDELLGNKSNDYNLIADLSETLRSTDRQLSNHTKNKRHDSVINTQFAVISGSNDSTRANNNAITVCQAYQDIQEDNSLEYTKAFNQNQTDIYSYRFKGFGINKIAVAECQNFFQIPAKELLEKHNIAHVNTTETNVPEVLHNGYIWTGKSTYKGNTIDTYMSNESNISNLPLVPMGQMGSGKTTLLGGIANNVIDKTKEGIIIIDFIKKCELSDYVKIHTPKERIVEIDLSIPEQRQSFCFNELNVERCKTLDEVVDTASLLAQETIRLIDSINTEGEPLKPKMRRYLSSACNMVFTYPNTCLKDVVYCIEDHEKRHEYINNLSPELKIFLNDEINNLLAIDEVKDNVPIGTKDGKIDGIIDRINLLKEDSKLKYMFNKSPKNNINFVEAMNEGKVVLIKMPQAKFNRQHRNILTTFFISKIWLACTIRGDTQDKPLRNHLIIDEIFDAPTSFKVLEDMLVQVRKFQLKLIFSVHYLNQIEPIREALKASGASYMLLQGTDKKNYKELESELQPYTVNDLLNLKQYNSLNLIKYSKGYATFISDLKRKI